MYKKYGLFFAVCLIGIKIFYGLKWRAARLKFQLFKLLASVFFYFATRRSVHS